MRIINRYVLREIGTPFLLGLGVFTLILLIARILKLVELVVNRGVPLFDVLRLFSYILPAFLEVTVPMAVLLAVIVAFGRLSSDSELVALKASGISLYTMAVPVAMFAVVMYVVSLAVSFHARPWGNSHLRTALYEIAKTRTAAGIREKVFTDEFDGMVIYVDQIVPPGNMLRGILISDSRDAIQRNTIFARVGFLVPNDRFHILTLRLVDGTIHAFNQKDHSYHRTEFASYDLNVDLDAALANLQPRERDPSEMTVPELREVIATKQRDGQPALPEMVEFHRTFSIPFACLVFAAIGVPLGVRPSRAVRSRGFSVSIALVFMYYLLLTAGESLGQRGIVPPAVALWLPNLLLALFATTLFVRAARETSITQPARFESWVLTVQSRFAAWARQV